MKLLARMYPELDTRYGISNNMGYDVPRHRRGLELYGYTQFHRKKFKSCDGAKYNKVLHFSDILKRDFSQKMLEDDDD